jgi:hypothetical protein
VSWLTSIFTALLTGAIAAVAAGFVGAACVDWYSIPGREGESGYFIVAVGLLGGIVGFIAGIVISRFIPGFLKAAGYSIGSMLAACAVAALIARVFADVPPEIHGHQLNLTVEFRLPAGVPDPRLEPVSDTNDDEKTTFQLGSVNPWSNVWRKSRTGTLDLKNARLTNGRWVVPAKVFVFTGRGNRSIVFFQRGKPATGFALPLPSNPSSDYEKWSEWLPRGRPKKPWPDSEISYRFRVEERLPPPPEPDPEQARAEAFAALSPDAPLEKWLGFLKYGMPKEPEQTILTVVQDRPADLAKLIRSPDMPTSDPALYAVTRLKSLDPVVVQAVRDTGDDIAAEIRKFNMMKPSDPGYIDLASRIRDRFAAWHQAWWSVQQHAGIDTRPLLEEILDLAAVHNDSGHMREVVLIARTHLDALPEAPKRPQ